MIVVAMIGILTAIAAPTLMKYRTKAKNALAVSEIRILEQELKIYRIENMRLPESLGEIKMGYISDPWGNPYQYLKIIEDDDSEDDVENEKNNGNEKSKGKGNQKEKLTDEKKDKPRKDHFLVPVNSDFDLYSMGEDGESQAPFTAEASHDDIVRAGDGKYVGLVSEF
jgi:general secretion pathway protein G